MKCQKCGTETFLPFRCQYCGGYFCSEHRLPEGHDCPQMEEARLARANPQQMVAQQPSHKYTVSYPSLRPASRQLSFSEKEIKHLAVASLLIVGVGLSLVGFTSSVYNSYLMVALFASMFTVSFLTHEIAHKVMAQKHGLWAEFRLTLLGAMLTLLSALSPILKIIAPGAVVVSGSADRKTIGKTSVAGPVTNMIFGAVFLSAAFVLSQYASILVPVAAFNAWIAVFNLVPLGILDGFKIFSWNKKVWTSAFLTSIILTVASIIPFR